MGRRPRWNRSPGFKAGVVFAAIRREQIPVELSWQFDVYVTQIKRWKDQILEGGNGRFRG
jgi:transposase